MLADERPDPPPAPTPDEARERFESETLDWLPDVRRYALRLTGDPADADDLVQTTYLNALVGWHTFRPGSDVRKWLFAICRNAFLRTRSRDQRWVTVEDSDVEALAAARVVSGHEGRALLDAMDRVDLSDAIDAAIGRLPEPYRLAVMMVDVEGLAYEEAARETGVPIGTIRSRLYRGRRLLQEDLLERAQDMGIARNPS